MPSRLATRTAGPWRSPSRPTVSCDLPDQSFLLLPRHCLLTDRNARGLPWLRQPQRNGALGQVMFSAGSL